MSPSGPALQFNIEEEEVMDHEDEPQVESQGSREPSEQKEGDTQIPTRHNAQQERDTPGTTGLNKVPPIVIPQTFAPGLDPSPPSSPMARSATGNMPRQRRVSSVSSSHSIRQVGSYGVSPARKANPYYSGVIARYSNGNKILHERDHSSSSLRRSNTPGSDQTRKAKLEATVENLESPTLHGVTSSSRDHTEAQQEIIRESASDVPPAPMFTARYEEEYDVEKDESARSSIQGSPFQTIARRGTSPGRSLFHPLTPSLSKSALFSGGISQFSDQNTEHTGEDSEQQQRQSRPALPSPETTWSTATGALTDIRTIPDSLGSLRTDSHRRGMDSFDSQASIASPSISTLSSAQVTNDFQDHSLQSGEHWDASPQDHGTNPVVLVQRPSTEISILPEKPFVQTHQLSGVSSVQSGNSDHPVPAQPIRLLSMAQWSESSYDPCAPIRWDELFEMDPNSRGPLWLSNRGLGQIPHEFFDGLRNLRELYLDHNDIKVVPDSLLKLSKLDVLDLSCNSISSFHSAFKMKKLKNLRRLNLDQNMLTDISPIYKLKSLRELRLNHNFVGHLAIAIQNMTKLKILTMESNSLVTLPETMGKLGNLCELRLSDNNLRALPESIGTIRTLQVLALRSNLLERLPESWKELENLTTLDLACNRLTSLPQDLVRLPKLTHLDLHDNQIQALPDKIGQLSNLVVLHLCNNHLRELPKDIGRLRDLQDLILSFNFIQVLPDEIGKLNKLQELKFDNNPLRSLPKTIQRLVNVRRVHLQGCALRDLPVELGVAFKELIYLDLSGNQFEVMPPLDQMYKLEEFYISNNYLREIGTSSLNLSNSNNNSNNYNTGTLSGPMGGGLGMANNALVGSGSMSQSGSGGNSSGGVTASKLSDLKRLRVFEAHHNQIRVLSSNIKVLNHLEVLDLSDNLLSWLPKEVGDLALLKVLLLKDNPIKSLPSSLTKLMGSLEVFRIGEWPENGFEITREQHQMNMKINVLQSFMPQQIERTLLWRMHDSILRRVQELDSQQYRDQHDLDGVTGAGPVSLALTTGSMSPRGTTLALSASTTNALNGRRLGISQGLAIATQNMMVNRSFALPPVSGGENDSITTTSSIDQSKTELQSMNSEGINPNYADYPTIRTLPTLQFSSATKHYSSPITSQPLTTSPSSTSPSGSLSAFPLLNSLRPRKSQQQLNARNGGLGAGLASSRPKSMYTHTSPHQQEQQQHPQILQKLNNRMSRVFDFATGSKTTLDLSHSSSTLESSTLQLSSDAMMALGLETNPGSAGSVIRHNNGGERVIFARGGRLGDGNLSDIKYSMAIKSSPSLTSTPLTLFSPHSTSPAPGTTSSMSANSGRPSTKTSKTSFGRSVSPLPSLVSEKSTTPLPWLRLRTSSSSPVSELPQSDDYATSTLHSGANSLSATSLLLRQPSLTESLLKAPTPPPILLNYDLDTDASLDIPSHMYYSAGGDDVDGDRPVGEDGEVSSVHGDGLGIDGESDEEDDHSTTTRGGRSRASFSGKSRRSKEYQQHQHQHQQHQQQNLNSTDPVLKIAVLKGIYDQILQNMDQIAEHNIQESPAKKNNRFKLLNSLKFLKSQSNSSGGGSGYHSHGMSSSMGHITTTLQ
ncbi:hypothetical protein BG005_002240 [Podila minutissima]|nr:hypothetical protein BG005_002240 [Podila minutissima]